MLEMQHICFNYGRHRIFDDLNWQLEEHKVYGVLGHSGCGKTTLLRIMAGLIQPQKGSLYFSGEPLTKPRKEICMMHQRYTNFPWMSCLENILFGIKASEKITKAKEEEARFILKQVGLEEYETSFPYELSGGMQQRLALGRSLIKKPQLLLMDEPLSALDPELREEMQQLIIKEHQLLKNTIVLVTHSPEEARKICDEIIEL